MSALGVDYCDRELLEEAIEGFLVEQDSLRTILMRGPSSDAPLKAVEEQIRRANSLLQRLRELGDL